MERHPMFTLLKLMHRVNIISIKVSFSEEIDKLTLKVIWKYKGPRISKTISTFLKMKNRAEKLTPPNFKT